MSPARKVELELLLLGPLQQLAGEGSMCWTPRPSAAVFSAEEAAAAAERSASRCAELVLPLVEGPQTQIAELAKVLLAEFDGPDRSESACEMAVRVLREQRNQLSDLPARTAAVRRLEARVDTLEAEARRFYHHDGTFEVLPTAAEVVLRRITAAQDIDGLRSTLEALDVEVLRLKAENERRRHEFIEERNHAKGLQSRLVELEGAILEATPNLEGPALNRLDVVFETVVSMHAALQRAKCLYCDQVLEAAEAAAHMEKCEKHPAFIARNRVTELEQELAAERQARGRLEREFANAGGRPLNPEVR